MTLERDIEKYLADAVKRMGGICRKVAWINRRGAPDRIVLLNGVRFVELKTSKGKLSKIQEQEIETLKKHGADAHVLWSKKCVDTFIRWCQEE